jgi:hypothetical protein
VEEWEEEERSVYHCVFSHYTPVVCMGRQSSHGQQHMERDDYFCGLCRSIRNSNYEDSEFEVLLRELSQANTSNEFLQILEYLKLLHVECTNIFYGPYPNAFLDSFDICTKRLLKDHRDPEFTVTVLEYMYAVSDYSGWLSEDHSYVMLYDTLSCIVDEYDDTIGTNLLQSVIKNAWNYDEYRGGFVASIRSLMERTKSDTVRGICREYFETID